MDGIRVVGGLTQVASLQLQDEVFVLDEAGHLVWRKVVQICVSQDDTWYLWFEGQDDPKYFVEDDTLVVRREVAA